MGNFTSNSWGLVQMKTNGEADSSQVSGNCRDGGGRDNEKNSLASSYTGLACQYCAQKICWRSWQRYSYESFSESLFIRLHRANCRAWCNTTGLTATDSYESRWVLCTIIAQLMMQSLMRAAAALVSSKDDSKYMTTGKKFLFQTQCCVHILFNRK